MSDREKPRVVEPVRNQLSLQPMDLEALVADEHPVRAIWALVERLDLSGYYEEIASRGSNAGRPATDPRVMLALWLFANSEGVGSARLLERLCERDAPYRWICGGVPVNHHTLSDFRVEHGKKLDRLLTQTLAVLMKQGVVKLKRVAQDGMKVRASAGAASFKRKQSLERAVKEAEQQVRRLKRELADDPGAGNRRVAAAKERAARARLAAVEAALAEIPIIEEKREAQAQKQQKKAKAKEVRASTTDAGMPRDEDGGRGFPARVQRAVCDGRRRRLYRRRGRDEQRNRSTARRADAGRHRATDGDAATGLPRRRRIREPREH